VPLCARALESKLTARRVRLRVREQHDAAVALLHELLERDAPAVVGVDGAAEAVERDRVAGLGRRAPVRRGRGFGARRRHRLAGLRQRLFQLRRARFALGRGFFLCRRLRGRRGLALAQLDHCLRCAGGGSVWVCAVSFGRADGWRGGWHDFRGRGLT